MGSGRSVGAQLAPAVGESLWALAKEERRIECELHACGDEGFAVHVLRGGELCVRSAFERRDLAIAHADSLRRDLGANGWRADAHDAS